MFFLFLFNHKTFKGTPERNHHYTLLNGEMIIDTDPHTHKQERRYLIYDLIAINQDLTDFLAGSFYKFYSEIYTSRLLFIHFATFESLILVFSQTLKHILLVFELISFINISSQSCID